LSADLPMIDELLHCIEEYKENKQEQESVQCIRSARTAICLCFVVVDVVFLLINHQHVKGHNIKLMKGK